MKAYPDLAKKGSVREKTVIGPSRMRIYDNIPYGGYYTQDECRDIVRYAAERYINVVPEIDMPGHMQSALHVFPNLGCTGGPYPVAPHWGVMREVLCGGNPETLKFLKTVFGELCDVFPSPYIHIGGYNFKKYKISYILLLALFLTFSLAGWLIASLGFLLHKLGNNKLRFYWVSLILIFLLAFVSFFKSYNGGDNIVNNVMLERLQASETEYTIISGYNRSSASLREYFWNDFLYSENIWLGRPDYLHYFGYEETMISDWTAFVIRHGWIGLVSFILFVVYYPLCSHKKKYALTTYSILYLLIFSQTIFLVFGYMYLTVYSLGCSEIMNENSKVNIAN